MVGFVSGWRTRAKLVVTEVGPKGFMRRGPDLGGGGPVCSSTDTVDLL